jgi:inward rectifier potassium channel
MALIKRRNSHKSPEEWGFGNQLNNRSGRMMASDGSFLIERTGNLWEAFNPYHWLINLSWARFFGFTLLFYNFVNLGFTVIYLLIGVEYLSGDKTHFDFWHDFFHAFFFSTQTFTTVGYGGVTPMGLAMNTAASLEALAGIMSAALMSGLFFARFSKAKPSIAFSSLAVIAPYEGGTALMLRIANRRNNNMTNIKAQVSFSYLEIAPDGNERREFDRLKLETENIQLFPLNWTLVHPIDEDSLLWQKTNSDLEVMDVEILAIISGYDDTFAQTVHSRKSYKWYEVKYGYKFLPMYYTHPDGMTELALDKIDAMMAV